MSSLEDFVKDIRYLDKEQFAKNWLDFETDCYETSANHGFHEDREHENVAEKIALIHSELSEALEALRHNNPPDSHIPEFTGVEAELADAVIRIADLAASVGYDVGNAIIAKMEYNRSRPYKHGKKF